MAHSRSYMRARPAPKDMPLEWEEICAAWLLLLLGLGLVFQATWWCVWKKPRRRCAMELELDASLPDAKETPEEQLQNLLQREANLNQALNRVRQRASSLRSKLQERKLEPKVEPQTESPSVVRAQVDDNHTPAVPGADLSLLTVVPVAVRQLSQLPNESSVAVAGSRSPLTSSPDPADDRRHSTIASSVAALGSLSPPDPADVRRSKLPVSLRVRHVDGTPPELCLACFDCPCACSRTSMRSVRG